MQKFEAYPEYEETAWPWLDRFPAHWAPSRVKYDSYVKARVGWHGLKSDEFTDEGPYLVTGTDFSGGSVDWQDCKHCTQERYDQDPYIQLQDGDLLITKDGTIGKLAIVPDLPGPASLNSGIFVIRPLGSRYLPRYYYWLLSSPVFSEFIDHQKTGSTINHLYQDTFVNFGYPLPAADEQRTIAAFLDHETAKIDRLIAKQDRLIELLKEKRQAVISHAVTKGLNPDAPMKDSGVEWLGGVPAHWMVMRVKHVCGLESGHTPSKTEPSYWIEEQCDINWVSLNDTKTLDANDYITETRIKISPLGMANSSAHLIPTGAVVFNRDGARVGLAAITQGEMCVSQHIIAWVCGPRILNTYLLHVIYAMRDEIYRITWGSTIPTIGMSDIKQMICPVPPLSEQREIADYLFLMRQRFDKAESGARRSIELLQERRAALISAAVTGKIDLRASV